MLCSRPMFTTGRWAILELMGHRRLGGWVTEVELFGAKMCRIDIPSTEGGDTNDTLPCITNANGVKFNIHVTQFYGGGSVYCVTPCTHEAAFAVAKTSQPAPVQPWELPRLPDPRDHDDDERD